MSEYVTHNNAIGKEASRIIHLKVLKTISDIVMQTAGPKGSTTMITKADGTYPVFSKDGKKVAESINIFGTVENAILDQALQIVQEVVRRVGDGTTSTIRLMYYIFKGLVELENKDNINMNTYDIINKFQTVVKKIVDIIITQKRDLTPEKVYDICMISTNGDSYLSNLISDLYNQYGNQVYIEIKSSPNENTMTKVYDGLTINKGYASAAYINKPGGICSLRNPRIYVFKDPIDTPEMIGFFTRIVYDNIITPYQNIQLVRQIQANPSKYAATMDQTTFDDIEKHSEMIPTVIMCPFISRDVSTILESLESILYGFDRDDNSRAMKPPIAIVTKLSQYVDEMMDMSLLCGCKSINKYIDPTVQQKDIEAGMAPTVDNVTEFFGTAEEVVIDKEKTKIINPDKMYEKNEDGKVVLDEENQQPILSRTFLSLVSFLTSQLDESEKNGDSPVEVSRLRRRLNGLQTSIVELYIGGISVTDRESTKDLADDAVRNCRSAAASGYGKAANFEAIMASKILNADLEDDLKPFNKIIHDAYMNLIKELYESCMPKEDVEKELENSLTMGEPINLRTLSYDNNVITSIESDIVVLECISKVLTIMFTTNQILIPSPMDNTYAAITE